MHPLQLSVLIIVKTDIEKVVNRKMRKNRNYYTNLYKISHYISVIIVILEFIEKGRSSCRPAKPTRGSAEWI
jgi:hypothetical protein